MDDQNVISLLKKWALVYGKSAFELEAFAKNEKSKGLANVSAHVKIISSVSIRDGCLDILEDVDSVNDDVLPNMIGEGPWAFEDGSHLLELSKVSCDTLAIRYGTSEQLDVVSNNLEARKNTRTGSFLEIIVCCSEIINDLVSVFNAVSEVGELLTNCSLNHTNDDLLCLLGSL